MKPDNPLAVLVENILATIKLNRFKFLIELATM